MRKEGGKKLSFKKLSIAKLDNLSAIRAGYNNGKSREPNCTEVIYMIIYTHNNQCHTNAEGCTDPSGPTVIAL